jgi:hypothetical protein
MNKLFYLTFILLNLFLNLSCSTNRNQVSNQPQEMKFSIVQGLTSSTTTEINVLVKKGEIPKIVLQEKDSKIKISEISSDEKFIEGAEWGIKYLKYQGLKESKIYELLVINSLGEVVDQRELKTLNLANKKPRLAIVSCMDDEKNKEQIIMWEGLLSQSPDMIFLIGDQVYADWKSGKKLATPLSLLQVWNRYVDSRSSIDLYKSKTLIPSIALWDDHDYGANDGDETSPIKDEMKKLFYSFYPQNEESDFFKKGPGVSSVFSAFGQTFIFLDNRSFRTPNLKPIICEKMKNHKFCQKTYINPNSTKQTLYGEETENWAMNILKNSKGTNWLISGDQFFGGYHPFESYEGTHPESFKIFLNKIKSSGKTVLFVSGDRHLSEVMKIEKSILGFETFEITSSGMHAAVFPAGWDEFPNPRQVAGAGQTLNYTIVETNLIANKLKLKVEAFGPLRKPLYVQELEVNNK